MNLLRFLRGMKCEDNFPQELTLRTSRTSGVLGSLLILAGVGLLFRSFIYAFYWRQSFLGFLGFLGFCVALGFVVVGLLTLAYRKCVIVSQAHSKIEFMESGILCQKRATYHFNEVEKLEVCRISECVVSSPICMWAVKGYLERGNGTEVVRLFECARAEDAVETANLLSSLFRVEVVNEPLFPPERDFSKIRGVRPPSRVRTELGRLPPPRSGALHTPICFHDFPPVIETVASNISERALSQR